MGGSLIKFTFLFSVYFLRRGGVPLPPYQDLFVYVYLPSWYSEQYRIFGSGVHMLDILLGMLQALQHKNTCWSIKKTLLKCLYVWKNNQISYTESQATIVHSLFACMAHLDRHGLSWQMATSGKALSLHKWMIRILDTLYS